MGLHPAGFCTSPWPPGLCCTRSSSKLRLCRLNTAASVSPAATRRPCCGGGGTGTGEHRRCSSGGTQDRMWHVCGHFSVCTVTQRGLGILHGKWGVCGPHPAKPPIKPSSVPCPGHSLCSPELGGFCTNILLLPADREAQHAPALNISLALHLQAVTNLPAWPEHSTMAREKVDLPAAMLGWGNPSVREHPFPLHSTIPCSVVQDIGIFKIWDNWARSAGGKEGCINRNDIFTGCIVQARAGWEHNEPLSLSAGILTTAPWKGPREQTAAPAKLQVCAATTKCLEDRSKQQEALLRAGCPAQLAEPDPTATLGALGALPSSGVTGRRLQRSQGCVCSTMPKDTRPGLLPLPGRRMHPSAHHLSLPSPLASSPVRAQPWKGRSCSPSILLCAEGWGWVKGSRETRTSSSGVTASPAPAPCCPGQGFSWGKANCELCLHGKAQRVQHNHSKAGMGTSFREFLLGLGTGIAPPSPVTTGASHPGPKVKEHRDTNTQLSCRNLF